MKGVIGSILPLAIAVTISPVPIIAEILLLFTKKPVANAACYLAGFIVGVAGVLAILVAIAGTINLSAGSGPSKGASILQLALGALLLVAALRQFRGRPKPGEEASMPKWMSGIAGFAPGKSLIVGVGIGALNPKNIIVGVAAPLVVTLAMGEKAQAILDSWKAWLGQNNAVVMTVLFLIFAVVLIGKGIAGI